MSGRGIAAGFGLLAMLLIGFVAWAEGADSAIGVTIGGIVGGGILLFAVVILILLKTFFPPPQ